MRCLRTQALHINQNLLTTNLPVNHSRGIVMASLPIKMQGKHLNSDDTILWLSQSSAKCSREPICFGGELRPLAAFTSVNNVDLNGNESIPMPFLWHCESEDWFFLNMNGTMATTRQLNIQSHS